MSESGNFKWVLLVVAAICLWVINQRRSGDTSGYQFQDSVEVQQPANDHGVYTSTESFGDLNGEYPDSPEPMNGNDWLRSQEDWSGELTADSGESLTIDSTVDRPLPVEPELPFQDSAELEIEDEDLAKATDDFFRFESPEDLNSDAEIIAEKTPAPQIADVATRIRNNNRQSINLAQGVQMKAVQHIEYGKSLARRGAVFGAQKEFNSALRLVAQALDYQFSTREYSERLYRALVAMNEADDYYFAQSENNGRVDVAEICRRHQSNVLEPSEATQLSAVEAMQAYYNFVQDQLSICGGGTVVAGEAMYCLGKLFALRSKNVVEGTPLDNAKAIVYHRAALDCDPANFKSANELAVLLAKTGRFEQAKELLIRSLKIKQIPRAWENLARVHQQLGEEKLASLAISEYQRMLGAPPTTNRIQWVSPQQFADSGAEPPALRTAQAKNPPEPTKPAARKSSFKNVLDRLF